MGNLEKSNNNFENQKNNLENQKNNVESSNVENRYKNIYEKTLNKINDDEYKDLFIEFIDSIKNEENRKKVFNILDIISSKKINSFFSDTYDEMGEENIKNFISENSSKIDNTNNSIEKIETQTKLNQKEKNIYLNLKNIDKLNDKDKGKLYIINGYIKLIKSYLSIDNLSEFIIKEIGLKLNILNKLQIDLKEKEKAEIAQKKAENAQKKAENAQKKAEIAHEKLKSKIGNLKGIDKDFDNLIVKIENLYKSGNLDEHREAVKKLLENYFLENGVLSEKGKDFLNKLQKKKPEIYKDTLQNLSNISPTLEILFQKKIEEANNNGELLSSTIVIKKTDSVSAFFPNSDKIEKRGNIYSSGDKYIDFNKKPPLAYIEDKSGFRLRTKFDLPNTLDIKSDFQKAKLEFEPKIKQTKEKIQNIKQNITNQKINYEQLKTKLQTLENQPENTETKLEIAKTKKEIEKIQILIEQEGLKLKLAQDTLKTFVTKLKKAKEKFNKLMLDALKNSGNTIEQRDEEVRNRMEFLKSIGFTTFPESVTNVIFGFIKNHRGIINLNMGGKTIGGKIDLANGLFGGDKVTGKDSTKNKEIFIALFNKMISGNPGEPINADLIVTGKAKNSFSSKTELIQILKKNGIINDLGGFNINKIEENLLNTENNKK